MFYISAAKNNIRIGFLVKYGQFVIVNVKTIGGTCNLNIINAIGDLTGPNSLIKGVSDRMIHTNANHISHQICDVIVSTDVKFILMRLLSMACNLLLVLCGLAHTSPVGYKFIFIVPLPKCLTAQFDSKLIKILAG